jgi:nitroreductase
MMLGDLVNGPRARSSGAWSQRQAYIALGFLLKAAALKSIDACPMEGIDSGKYDEILNLKETEYSSVAVAALGFRAKDDASQHHKKVRFDVEHLVTRV